MCLTRIPEGVRFKPSPTSISSEQLKPVLSYSAIYLRKRRVAVDEELDELRRQLDQKTTEIESLIAKERGLGSIENMDPADYQRLQRDVEELLERWEEAEQEAFRRAEDSPLNRLIAERFEIEQQVEAAREDKGEIDDEER
jgi:hypothetical protein